MPTFVGVVGFLFLHEAVEMAYLDAPLVVDVGAGDNWLEAK